MLFSALCVWQIQTTLPRGAQGFYNTLLVDHFALYFWYLFLASAAITILISARYLEIENENHGEYYALLLFSVVGMMCMAAGVDIVLLFIGLELMAISIYVLVGFLRRDRRSNEAALKYLLLGAFSSGIFAYGLSLLYGLSGSTNLRDIARAVGAEASQNPHNPILIIALLTTLVGLLFKIAAVPFHQWAPDAYEGAPTSITAFMSVAVKAAAWALLLRILIFGLLPLRSVYTPDHRFRRHRHDDGRQSGRHDANEHQATARLFFDCACRLHAAGAGRDGDIALRQSRIRDGIKGILIYLLVYTFMNLGVFAVITSLRQRNVIGDEIDDLAGLYSARSRRSRAHAAVSVVARRNPACSGLSGQVLHLPQPDREPALLARRRRPSSTRCSAFITTCGSPTRC